MQNHPSQTWPIGCLCSMKTVILLFTPLPQALGLSSSTLQQALRLQLRPSTLQMLRNPLALGRPPNAASVSLSASPARRIRRPGAPSILPLPMLLRLTVGHCLSPLNIVCFRRIFNAHSMLPTLRISSLLCSPWLTLLRTPSATTATTATAAAAATLTRHQSALATKAPAVTTVMRMLSCRLQTASGSRLTCKRKCLWKIPGTPLSVPKMLSLARTLPPSR